MLFIGITTKDNRCFVMDQDGQHVGIFILGAAHQDLCGFQDWLSGYRDGHHECYAMICCHDATPESSRRLGMWQGVLELLSVIHCSINVNDDSNAEVVAWKCKWKFEKDDQAVQRGTYWSDEWGVVFVENDSAWFATPSGTVLKLSVADAEKLQLVPIEQKIGESLADNDYPELDVS